jgi:hypothetical protein
MNFRINIANRIVFFILFLFAIEFFSAQNNSGTLKIKIHPVFNQTQLILSDHGYINTHGDSVYIDDFKFYLCKLCLKKEGANSFCEVESYHLVDAEDSVTQTIVIKNIPEGTYSNFSFNIGVDSLKNVSGALTGDLDPIKGMYWAWNTGYIAARIIGHSKVCKTLHNEFEFHIGGYLSPYNSLRKNSIKLDDLKIVSSKTTVLELYADVAEWFKTPVTIDVSKTNSVVLPNKQAMIMANNYSDMIKFKKSINP